MSINKRTPVVRKSHGESLVRLGEKIQESVIYACFVTPFLFLGKSLFDGEHDKISSYIDLLIEGGDFIVTLFVLMSFSIAVGIYIKNKGYDLIEGANSEINT